jgi:hypothetical protein
MLVCDLIDETKNRSQRAILAVPQGRRSRRLLNQWQRQV